MPTVCKSAKAAETRALDKTVDDAIYVTRILAEVYYGTRIEAQLPVTMYTDNRGTIDSINSTKPIEEKHLRPLIKSMQENIASGYVKDLYWCPTRVCMPDMLTKEGSSLKDNVLEVLETGKMFGLQVENSGGN